MDATVVERDPVEVLFVHAAADEVDAIRAAWSRLEELVALRGRRFVGAFFPRTQEYRACTVVREGDDPAALGLEPGTLPGGRYAKARLRGEPPALYERIAPTFDELAAAFPPDESRPSLELYRRRDEVDLLLPVA